MNIYCKVVIEKCHQIFQESREREREIETCWDVHSVYISWTVAISDSLGDSYEQYFLCIASWFSIVYNLNSVDNLCVCVYNIIVFIVYVMFDFILLISWYWAHFKSWEKQVSRLSFQSSTFYQIKEQNKCDDNERYFFCSKKSNKFPCYFNIYCFVGWR